MLVIDRKAGEGVFDLMRKLPAFFKPLRKGGPLIDERTPFDSFDFSWTMRPLMSRDRLIYSDVIILALH